MNKTTRKANAYNLAKEVECNPFLLKQYKRQLEEKNKVIKEMTKMFKRMNMSEKLLYIKTKEMEVQKAQYEQKAM